MPDLLALARRVVVPILNLRADQDLPANWATARQQAADGFGGLILFGGELGDVQRGLAELRQLAPQPILIASDLERGLGQQVQGGADAPPLQALGAADDEALARRAGRALGRAARQAGIDWVFGPVLDLAELPQNPIVGARSFGADPARVSALGAAYLSGIQEAGALACGKHFPGHGSTTGDSHAELPRVTRSREQLERFELAPFRAAIAAGVGSLMTAHIAFPALGAERKPATLTPAVLGGLLRERLGFEGLIVTDAFIMEGVLETQDEADAACAALEAGADVILYPHDPEAVAARLAAWAAADEGCAARLRGAVARLDAALARLPDEPPAGEDEAETAAAMAAAALTRLGAAAAPLAAAEEVGVLLLDDDDVPGFGHELVADLQAAGVPLRLAALGSDPSADALAAADALAGLPRRLAVVGCRVRAWKGRPGLSPALQTQLAALAPGGLTVVGLCGPFPLDGVTPAGAEVLVAYGDAPVCQAAAAAALLGRADAPGRLPVAALAGHSGGADARE
jgi:beta-glucosidase-like glycosyl hydrolase